MSTSKRTTVTAQVVKKPIDPVAAAELERVRRRNRRRDLIANVITVIMLLLTLAVLGWVAYQINNPIALNISGLFGR